MSHRSQVAISGSSPIAACSAACRAPGTSAASTPAGARACGEMREPDRDRPQLPYRQVQRPGVDHLAGADPAALVRDDLAGHVHLAEEQPDRAGVHVRADRHHGQVGDVAGVGGPVRLRGVHQRDRVVQVQVVDHVRDALVQVDRPGVQHEVRRARVDGAEQPPGGRLDHGRPGAPPVPRRSTSGRPRCVQYQPAGPPPQRPGGDQRLDCRDGRGAAEQFQVGRGERAPRTAAQHSCGPSTYGLVGSSTVASTGRPNSASGWCTR